MAEAPNKEVATRGDRQLLQAGFSFMPQTWNELFNFAKEIAQTDFVPKSYRSMPGAVLAAWQKGKEVGLPPMAALESIAIINGRASIHSDGYWSLIINHPMCEEFSELAPHEIKEKGYAECTIKRRGNSKPIVRRYSLEDAKIAGLLDKDNWKHYPQTMLMHRARHACGSAALPEATQGLLPADVARDIEPEPRDVTPYQTPHATTDENPPAAASSATDAVDSRPADEPEKAKEPTGQTADQAPAAPEPKEEAKKDRYQAALDWIEGFTKEKFPEPQELNPYIKGLTPNQQAKICAHFNAKRRELLP